MEVVDLKTEIDWNGNSNQGVNLALRDDETSIILNAIGCRKCKTTAISTHRHDYVSCKCGSISADGGINYLRRVGDMKNMIELSVVTSDHVKNFVNMVYSLSPVQSELKKKRKEDALLNILSQS